MTRSRWLESALFLAAFLACLMAAGLVGADTYTSGPAHGEGNGAFDGAAVVEDGRVVFAPGNSANVGIFDPSDDSYTSGPAHGASTPAFARATLLDDGRVMFDPHNAGNIGLFDPADDSYTSGPAHGEGNGAFFGAAVVSDGRVILAPHSSSNVGIFDPADDSYTSGPAHGEGSQAFRGAVLLEDGRVLFVPRDSGNIGLFDPSDDSYTSGPAHGEGGSEAFSGAAVLEDGRVVLAPWDSSNVGIFDPADDSYTSGPAHGEGGAAFRGAALMNDGRVVLAPRHADNVGIFDPADDSYTSGPAHGEGSDAFSDAALMTDGRVVLSPRSSNNVGIFTPTEPPNVTITNPEENSPHLTGDMVNVTANITQGDLSIDQVIIDTNGDGLHDITENLTQTNGDTFEVWFDWNVGDDGGDRDLVVQAFDTDANSGGDVVQVRVNTLNVTITNPEETSQMVTGSVVNVTGTIVEVGKALNESQPVIFDSAGDAGLIELNVSETSPGEYEFWGDWGVGEPFGLRNLTVQAFDVDNDPSEDLLSVEVLEAEPPNVTITNPPEASEHAQGSTVNVTAEITEGDLPLDEEDNRPILDTNQDDPGVVEMNLINVTGEDHDWEVWFEFEVKDPDGERDLVVQAFDTEANSGGDVVTVTVLEANHPEVTITNPAEASEHIQGATVNVTANITEGDFDLDEEQVLLDPNEDPGVLITMNVTSVTGEDHDYEAWANWTVGEPTGERNLVVQAFDVEGNSGGDTVTVTVTEAEGPSVTITNPESGDAFLMSEAVNVTANITEGDFDLNDDLVLLDPNEDPGVLLAMNVSDQGDGEFVAWAHWSVGNPAGFRNLVVQAFDVEGNSGGDTVTVTVNLISDPEDQDTRWEDLVGLDVNPASQGYQVWVRDRGDPAGSQTRIGTYDTSLDLIADEPACISTGAWSEHFLFGEAPSPWDGAMGLTALGDTIAVAACEQSSQDAVTLHVLGPDAQPLGLDDVDFSPKIMLEFVDASQTSYLATEAVRLDRNIFGAPVAGDGIDFHWVLWDWREENVVWEGTVFDTGTFFGDVAMSVDPDHPTAGVTIPGHGSRVLDVHPEGGTGTELTIDGVSIVLDGDVAFIADPSGAEAVQRYEDATTGDWNLTHEASIETLGGFPAANSLQLTADGKILTLVGGEQDGITLYDAEDLSTVAVIDHSGLRGAALAQDHKNLFAFDQDTVYVYDVQDELASAGLAPETITPDPIDDTGIPEEPTDFADGIDAAISGLGFQTGPSKMFFSLGLVGIVTVATAAGLRIMSSGRPKNLMILGAGALVGLFTVLLGFVRTWMYVVSLVVGGFVLGGGIQQAQNTFEEIQDRIREAREPSAKSPVGAPLPDPMHPPMKRGAPDLEEGIPSDAAIREVDSIPTGDDE